jgi:hypothetical protein
MSIECVWWHKFPCVIYLTGLYTGTSFSTLCVLCTTCRVLSQSGHLHIAGQAAGEILLECGIKVTPPQIHKFWFPANNNRIQDSVLAVVNSLQTGQPSICGLVPGKDNRRIQTGSWSPPSHLFSGYLGCFLEGWIAGVWTWPLTCIKCHV